MTVLKSPGAVDAWLSRAGWYAGRRCAFEAESPTLADGDDARVFAAVERVVLALNAVNEAHDECAFETEEREQLCAYIDEALTEQGGRGSWPTRRDPGASPGPGPGPDGLRVAGSVSATARPFAISLQPRSRPRRLSPRFRTGKPPGAP
ncbi:hypothetical protein ACWEL8_26200 [Streptomyces sp. NPDC004690]